MDTTVSKKGHPAGLYLLFFTEMWERFSYYGTRAILIYYLTKTYLQGGLSIDPAQASLIYGYFTGFVYFTPLIGGWLADKFLGQRLSITIGGVLMMLGQFTLFAINTHFGLYIGLLLLIIGNGFFKPNISVLVGNLYEEGDERRDSAFSIFYMGINLGALIAPLVIGVLTDDIFAKKDAAGEIMSYGYKYGFLAAGLGMLLGQVLFNTLAQKYLGNIGKKPKKQIEVEKEVEVIKEEIENGDELKKVEKQRVSVIFILFLFAVFFWAGFEQAGSSIALYTDNYIDRNVNIPFIGNYTIPASWFQSVNPFFIVALAPLFAMFWSSKLGKKLSTPVKMGLGMVILGIGFWFMLGAVSERGGDIADPTIKASLWWLVMTYFVHTVGELCLSPVGLSVVTKLAPVRLASVLMAVWLLSSSVANFLGGYIAAYVEKMGAGQVFTYISGFVIACGLLLLLLSKPISKMMHGVK
ncbi:peptide MFS transporter [Riemerella anatipestifer]|uniref:Amino acid/peptide transporter n=1 Tax=Riemerella anatipestifer (strain ATCC 11845 / DSM 15868 / JCM 9532 / NCTC 11014) TaxID=693978 RepID=E4TDA6_RIEAD|nr:peptide MFS transporter [Riemerella anatipestifer]ADQ82765.1 amino acid/peptide transporter [Riemerella anatipestifer ATCC 11845 = DSM 15868]AFD56776.1 amino acid/peptide transporter [Riemerella anatipestifer ATCC 11845 = DSM 15868]MRM92397.1 MFS transporter [Riemerella anatipestifer]SNV67551.1 Di-/tripeptide transporter [Riemerella anatipestifer]